MIVRLAVVYVANVVALGISAAVFDGVGMDPFWRVLTAALVFGVFNSLVKPIMKALSAPAIWLTLGVALFFVNILLVYIVSEVSSGFSIDSFDGAAATTIVLMVANWVAHALSALADRRHDDDSSADRVQVNGRTRRSGR